MLASSLLLSLALLPDAEAAGVPRMRMLRVRQIDVETGYPRSSFGVLTSDADARIARVSGELDGARITFTESDAWVHGTAALPAPPADGAELTLTVYDPDSMVLATFTGTYTGGALALTDAASTGLEVLAAAVYPDGTVGIDLAGADATRLAYATLASVETTLGRCVEWDRVGNCTAYDSSVVRTDAELDLDELGVVWESGEVDLTGPSALSVSAFDALGRRLDAARFGVAPAWEDEGEGVSPLLVDEDPFTSVGLVCEHGRWFGDDCSTAFVVTSDGWSLGAALPELARVSVEGGGTWTVPVNSYQKTALVDLGPIDLDGVTEVAVDGNPGVTWRERLRRKWFAIEVTRSAMVLMDDGATVWASITAWSDDPAALPTDVVITVGGVDLDVALEEEVTAVFALDAELATDGHGADLVGEVRLQGPPDARGRRLTLARGGFAGQLGVDGDGEPDLGTIERNGEESPRGDILIGGEPIDIERTGAPPVVAYKDANPTLKVKAFTRVQLGSP